MENITDEKILKERQERLDYFIAKDKERHLENRTLFVDGFNDDKLRVKSIWKKCFEERRKRTEWEQYFINLVQAQYGLHDF